MKTAEQRLAWALDYCRGLPLRRTRVRERILAFLAEQPLPVTVAVVAQSEHLRQQCDPATIYRTLMLFADALVVRQFRFHNKFSYFVLNVPGECFHYFFCTGCGALSNLPLSDDARFHTIAIRAAEGYRAESHELVVFGFCPRCNSPGRQPTPGLKIMSRLSAAPAQPLSSSAPNLSTSSGARK